MWKSKRNVSIRYTPLPPSSSSELIPRLDDLVSYQTLNSDKVKTVEGIDTPSSSSSGGEWDWRGKGWLKIASSHWEVLGWGDSEDGNQWVVTYFAKTLFTPAGVDVYSRRKEGLSEGSVEAVIRELGRSVVDVEDGVVVVELVVDVLVEDDEVVEVVVDFGVEVAVVDEEVVDVVRVVEVVEIKQVQADDTLDAGYAET
ncbi:MAG: hypothetical protein Q9218_003849 [Villophora microphyllina]